MKRKNTDIELNEKAVKVKKPKDRAKWQDVLLDTICCWFLSSGLVLMLYAQFMDVYSIKNILIFCAVILGSIAIGTRRKWIFPTILGVGVLGGCGYLLITKKFPWFINYVTGFFRWLMSNMNNANEKYATEINYTIVQIFMCIGISVIVFTLVRTLHSIIPVVAITGVLYVIFTLYGFRENNVLTLMFLAAGTMPIIATNFYNKRKPIASLFKKNKIDLLTPNWSVQATAIILCAISVLASVYVIPKDTANMINRFSTNITMDIQAATNLFSKDQSKVKQLNLHEIGLQPRKRIGGNLNFKISDTFKNEIVAYVFNASAEETYLKSLVLETYDGTMWTSKFDHSYRMNSPFFTKVQDATFNDYQTGKSSLDTMLKNNVQTRTIKIRTALDTKYLLAPCGLIDFKEITHNKRPVVYNSLSELFCFKDIPAGFDYEVTYSDASVNLDRITAISELTSKIKDANLLDKEFVSTYTQLPDNFPASVINHAQKLTAESKSDYMSVALMTQYLANTETFSYTNKPGSLPNGTDITVQLLRTKKGNSVYYATTLTLMARSLGIPSRLVAGYRVSGSESLLSTSVWNKDLKAFEVSEDDAFCWTECYIKGIGWVAFYPSPVSLTYAKPQAPQQNQDVGKDDNGKPQEDPTKKEDEEEEKEKKPHKLTIKDLLKALLYILIAIVAVLILLLIRSFFSGMFVTKHTFRNRENQALYYYWDMINQLKTAKILCTHADTSADLIAKSASIVTTTALADALDIVDRVRYSKHYLPTIADIDLMADVHKTLEKDVRKNSGKFRYFVRRIYLRGDKLTFIFNDLFKNISPKIKSIFNIIKKPFVLAINFIKDIIRRREG